MNNEVFEFAPPGWFPFRDREVLRTARGMSRREMENHTWEHPDFRLRIVPDVQSLFVIDFFSRLREADRKNEPLTVLLPNPFAAAYENVAELCNKYAVGCRNLRVFFLNEWADETGRVAPPDYEAGYGRLFRTHFLARLLPELRPPENRVYYFTDRNVADYSDLIDEVGGGGADVCYSSVGWSGRVAAIEAGDEWACDTLDTYLRQTSRTVTNHMISIAEDSLLGLFAGSGDLAAVPPKSATIGPRDIAHARDHFEMQYKQSQDGRTSWQRMAARLMLFGPVSAAVPASILRLYRGVCYMSEQVAATIEQPAIIPDEVTFARGAQRAVRASRINPGSGKS